MSNRIQVIICSSLLAIILVWLYFYQLEVPALTAQFNYQYALTWQEPWRLLTAHLLHTDGYQTLFNALALLLITIVFAPHFSIRTWLNALLVIAVITCLLLYAVGQPESFAGISGLLHGLLVLGILLSWSLHQYHSSHWLYPLVLVAMALKILFEYFELPVVAATPDTWLLHLSGALAGVVAWRLHRRQLASLARHTTSSTDAD